MTWLCFITWLLYIMNSNFQICSSALLSHPALTQGWKKYETGDKRKAWKWLRDETVLPVHCTYGNMWVKKKPWKCSIKTGKSEERQRTRKYRVCLLRSNWSWYRCHWFRGGFVELLEQMNSHIKKERWEVAAALTGAGRLFFQLEASTGTKKTQGLSVNRLNNSWNQCRRKQKVQAFKFCSVCSVLLMFLYRKCGCCQKQKPFFVQL